MQQINSSFLKAILHSKRANLYYLEHCRVMQKDGRVVYLTEAEKENLYWNIPIANTTVILLGAGTSITQAAMRMLASAGVLVGFSGGGGTPLIAATEVEWLCPQSEYRPTEYVQGWMAFWFDTDQRLLAAKQLQHARIKYLEDTWSKDKELQEKGFYIDSFEMEAPLKQCRASINSSRNVNELLCTEARFAKSLYKAAATFTNIKNFSREHDGMDDANIFLNHGNYLAYGLAATTLWVLGIPHGFAVMHGKTRRGALVFDIADLVKDALILPIAFICAKERCTQQEFRQRCLLAFTQHKALDFMFEEVKKIAQKTEWILSSYEENTP